MMKYFILPILFTTTVFSANAQSGSAKQVKWNFSSRKIAENTYELKISANITGNYHMYAQQAGAEGPVATTFHFNANPLVSLNGKVKENGKMIKKFESAWDATVNYYEKTVDFVQVVTLKGKVKTLVNGKVEFMVCNDSECLPPAAVDFKIQVGG